MVTTNFCSDVSRYAYALKPAAMSLTRDMDDAEDLIQDTVLRALICEDKFTDSVNLKGWLYTIMKNIFINNYTQNKKRKTIMASTSAAVFLDFHASVQNRGESNMEMDTIKKALDKLNDEIKVPFVMYYNGFKYREIADELSLALGTVKSRIFFARKELKNHLERH